MTRALYVASPLGFSEAGRAFYDSQFLSTIRGAGFEPLDPWALTDAAKVDAIRALSDEVRRRAAWRMLSHEIAEANRSAIDRSDGVVAVLDGPDVDSGTAAEIGYAFARGKRIVGYRGDFRRTGDNDGVLVNLQVEYFIRAGGGDIVASLGDLGPALRRVFG